MRYDFLIDSYATERIKVLSVWSEFRDEDLPVRPKHDDPRGRSVHEHMVHQCVSEDNWFRNMLGIESEPRPCPNDENRLPFIRRYAEDSSRRVEQLRRTDDGLVGGADHVLRRSSFESVGHDEAPDPHLASPRAADGDATDARPRICTAITGRPRTPVV